MEFFRSVVWVLGSATIVASASLAAFAADAPASSPKAPPSVELSAERVVIQRLKRDWPPLPQATPLLAIGNDVEMHSVANFYYWSTLGHTHLGTRTIIGYLGTGLPDASALVVDKFTRNENTFHLALRYQALAAVPRVYDHGPKCFFGASLPDELPDGDYRFSVTVRDLPAGTTIAAAAQELAFQRPDPRFKLRAEAIEAIRKLPHERLLERYRADAAAADDNIAPLEQTGSGLTMDQVLLVYTSLLPAMEAEIERRKFDISPALIELLKQEAARSAGLDPTDGYPRGIARKSMIMLTEIGDARAAPVLVDLVAGKLKCHPVVREKALEQLEILTSVRFRIFGPHNNSYDDAVRGPDAIAPDFSQHDPEFRFEKLLAAKYVKWLAEHPADGSDTAPWRNEARRSARAWLDGQDLDEAYNAASFLSRHDHSLRRRGDEQQRTAARIAAILEKCRLADVGSGEHPYPVYVYEPTGKLLPVTVWNWMGMLTAEGTISEHYAPLIIRFDRELTNRPGSMLNYLNAVPGTEAMAYRIEAYRRLASETVKLGLDPTTEIGTIEDKRKQAIVWNLQYARYGIERWAGRTFASDAEIDTWWAGAKQHSQRRWLEDGLPVLAAQSDSGLARAQYFLRVILNGELPNKPDHTVWNMPGWRSKPEPHAERDPPFRVKWLAENRAQLEYDEKRGTFRRKTVEAPK